MRKLIIATMIFVLAGLSASYARGGMHGGGMHGLGSHALMGPASPTVPPSLTPDARLIGSAPIPPHHQPTAADVSSLPDALLKPTPKKKPLIGPLETFAAVVECKPRSRIRSTAKPRPGRGFAVTWRRRCRVLLELRNCRDGYARWRQRGHS